VTFLIVVEVFSLTPGGIGSYMWQAARRRGAAADDIARYRRGTLTLLGLAVIVGIRLATNTHG
jgi:hypothetical protein